MNTLSGRFNSEDVVSEVEVKSSSSCRKAAVDAAATTANSTKHLKVSRAEAITTTTATCLVVTMTIAAIPSASATTRITTTVIMTDPYRKMRCGNRGPP